MVKCDCFLEKMNVLQIHNFRNFAYNKYTMKSTIRDSNFGQNWTILA
jgi:hypothetical protein